MLDSPPLISVVMPVRDAAATVARAVRSVQAQTWRNWELLAVDDGSADGTAAVLAALANEDGRVRVLTRPAEGIVAALNAGLAEARGELIARMDADDESHPERFAKQMALLCAEPGLSGAEAGMELGAASGSGLEAGSGQGLELGLVGCGVAFGGDRAAQAGYALHVDWLNGLNTPEEIALNRFVESPFAHPSVLFRRELVERWGGYRAGDFPEDYDLWLRWLDAGVRMAKVPERLLTWHDLPGRLSRTDARYDAEAFYRVKAEYLAREWARRRAAGETRALWVCGAGRPTRKRAAPLEAHGVEIAGYVDIDPKKTGRVVGGRPVIAPEQLPAAGRVFILGYVASRGARELIRADLGARGYREGRDFLMCA